MLTEKANRVINMFEKEGIVCPLILKNNLFTTGNLDNIDHNPSSTSSCDALHGTAISVTQHAAHENTGIDRMLSEVPENEGQRSSKRSSKSIDCGLCKDIQCAPNSAS